MKVADRQGGGIWNAAVDAVVVTHFEGDSPSTQLSAIDEALDGAIASMLDSKEFKGKSDEAVGIVTLGKLPAKRVVVAGLGKRSRFTPESARRAAGNVAKLLRRAGARTAAFHIAPAEAVTAEALARATVEGLLLASYSFHRYFSTEQQESKLESVELWGPDSTDLEPAIRLAETLCAGANFARDLVNEPPNVLHPVELASRAVALAVQKGLECEVFDVDELRQRGMNALLAVGGGSGTPPRLIVLRYKGDPDGKHPTLGLVGKGITFDTGGISLKPGADMHKMKSDMGGAAAMLGAIHAIADLHPKLNVTVIVATAENMPDGNSYRPGDIVKAMNGKSIEIQNTDAEGRIILSDALSYATALELSPIIDAATLTGACAVALGPFYSGVFSNDDASREIVLAAAQKAGERLWPMPMDPDYRKLLDTSCADMRNVGGRDGGAIIAATFLSEFVGDQPWVHLDIAPTAYADNDSAYYAKDLATGHPVRTLVQLALDMAES